MTYLTFIPEVEPTFNICLKKKVPRLPHFTHRPKIKDSRSAAIRDASAVEVNEIIDESACEIPTLNLARSADMRTTQDSRGDKVWLN